MMNLVKVEDRGHTEDRGQKIGVRSEDRGHRRSEDRGQVLHCHIQEDRGRVLHCHIKTHSNLKWPATQESATFR